MAKVGTILIEVDSNVAKLVKGVKESNKQLNTLQRSANKAKKDIADFAKAAVGVYAVKQAFDAIVKSSFNYNIAMDASSSKLKAMVANSLSFETTLGRQVNALERSAFINEETARTMDILKVANAETAMGMTELIDVYALMKPGMDATNVSLEDQIDILKLVTNTASNFGVSAQELSTGIDDLAKGTWMANSGFGKMMKTLGVTKDAFKASANKVLFLKEAMKDTGAAQDNWATATSNFSVHWDQMIGKITEPVFANLKEDIKSLTSEMENGNGFINGMSKAMESAYDTTKSFGKTLGDLGGYIKDNIQSMERLGIVLLETTVAYRALLAVSKLHSAWMLGEGAMGVTKFVLGMNGAQAALISATIAQKAFNLAVKLTPWGLAITGAVTLAEAIRTIYNAEQERTKLAAQWDAGASSRGDAAALTYYNSLGDKLSSTNIAISKMKSNLDSLKGTAAYDANLTAISNLEKKAKEYTHDIKSLSPSFNTAAKSAEKLVKKMQTIDLPKPKIPKIKSSGVKAAKAYASSAKKEMDKLKPFTPSIDAKELESDAKKQAERFANDFSGAFNGILGGDVFSAFESFFNNTSTTLVKPFVDDLSKSMSKGLDGLLGGLGNFGSALVGVGLGAAMSILSKFTTKTISGSEMKAAEGITTVLSPSVENSIERIKKNGTEGLNYSKQMVDSLESLVELSNKAASNIGSGLTGDNYVSSTDYGFFNDSTKELVASGIKLDSVTIKELNDGQLTASMYMTEKVTDSGFLGIGAGESLETTNLGAASSSVTDPILQAYLQGVDAIESAAITLGMSSDEFALASEQWETSIAQLNFAGKSQAEISEMINGVIAADMDTWAATLTSITPYIEEFKLAGEGYSETLIRLANDYEVVDRAMRHLSIVLPSVANGGLKAAESLIKAAGGMDAFSSSMDIFTRGFYTEAERAAMAGQDLQISMAQMGITMPATAAGFRVLMETLFATNADLAGQLMQLVPLADSFYNAMGGAGSSIDGVSSSCNRLSASAVGTSSALVGAADDFYALQKSIVSLQGEWSTGDVASAKSMLSMVEEQTGLLGLTVDNFLSKFNAAAALMTSQDELTPWQDMSSALKGLQDATEAAAAAIEEQNRIALDKAKEELSFYADILKKIDDAFLGSRSYMNSKEKAQYAGDSAQKAFDRGDTSDYFSNLNKQLEYEKKMSTTREAYSLEFTEYLNAMKTAEPEKTLDDVVLELKDIRSEIEDVRDTIRQASYQGA